MVDNNSKPEMIKLLITIPKKMHNNLLIEKNKTGSSMAEIVRRAINQYLNSSLKINLSKLIGLADDTDEMLIRAIKIVRNQKEEEQK